MGKFRLNVCPVERIPEFQRFVSPVEECVPLSQTQTTVSPALMVMETGLNVLLRTKFVTVAADAGSAHDSSSMRTRRADSSTSGRRMFMFERV